MEARAPTKPEFNFKPETGDLRWFQKRACGRGYVFFDCKVGHIKQKGHGVAAGGSHQSFVGLQQVKIKQHMLYNRTTDRKSFFPLKERALAEGLGHDTVPKMNKTAHGQRDIHITGRTNATHRFADQSKLLSAPRVREKLTLSGNTWWPLRDSHPAQQLGFCSSLASEAALSESHFQAVRTHLPTSNYTLSSLLLVGNCVLCCHDNHHDTRIC